VNIDTWLVVYLTEDQNLMSLEHKGCVLFTFESLVLRQTVVISRRWVNIVG
jgi:hypothetical protein